MHVAISIQYISIWHEVNSPAEIHNNISRWMVGSCGQGKLELMHKQM